MTPSLRPQASAADSSDRILDAAAVAAFATRLRGRLVDRQAADFEAVRAVWNAMIDRRPLLIAVCSGVADVIEAVTFAGDHGLPLAVRGGGHNIGGSALCDDGLVIDLSQMRAVRVDAKAKRAWVHGGALLGDLDRETQAFGLATPGGVISHTGVAGLTLGGGFGWLSRKYGLTADNLLSVELVTAERRLLRASAEDHPDLFWALRGGGGNFGVAVGFEFRLHPVGPEVLFGPTLYPLDQAAAVLRNYAEMAPALPRAACAWASLMTAPPLPFLDPRYHGTKMVSVMQCYAGAAAEGEAALAPLRGFGEPAADAVMARPFTAAQSLLDPMYAHGLRNYWTSANFDSLDTQVIDRIVGLGETLPTPQSDVTISQVGGAINDVAPDATAYPHRDAAFVLSPGARWDDPGDDETCLAWIDDCRRMLAEESGGGAYVNFIAESEGREREAYGRNYDRLAEVKRRYDPDNLFRINQNVAPG
ncbi:FAD-binding oxidoreductase [Pelagibius sp.]|uniref:FAD-binding oxidoreductase n=1 Tax=Pelagibius sp. TaxID=1931238 RepID=UPI00261D47C3|nr:FAD-binding oxidoreductase [Pelagibius sp.]